MIEWSTLQGSLSNPISGDGKNSQISRLPDYRVTLSIRTYVDMVVTVPHEMVGLERMSDCRGVGLQRFHCLVYYHGDCISEYGQIRGMLDY